MQAWLMFYATDTMLCVYPHCMLMHLVDLHSAAPCLVTAQRFSKQYWHCTSLNSPDFWTVWYTSYFGKLIFFRHLMPEA